MPAPMLWVPCSIASTLTGTRTITPSITARNTLTITPLRQRPEFAGAGARQRFAPRLRPGTQHDLSPGTLSPWGVVLTDQGVLFLFLSAHLVLGALVWALPAVAKLHFWATAILAFWFAGT